MKLDHLLFKKINDLAGESSLADWIGIFGARYLIIVIVASLFKYVLFYKNKAEKLLNYKVAAGAVLATVFGLGFNYLLSFLIDRPRPFELGLGINIYGTPFTEGSFPSEHATIAFAVATAVFITYRRFGSVLLVMAAIVGISRIFVGIHYPLDVLAGALVGAAMALLASVLVNSLVLTFTKKKKEMRRRKKK
jgi:undecaprenyl-diphosphatase